MQSTLCFQFLKTLKMDLKEIMFVETEGTAHNVKRFSEKEKPSFVCSQWDCQRRHIWLIRFIDI